jgi:CDGSH-type Zn-finger protein
MAEPKIAAKEPAKVKPEAGRSYAWCARGGSEKQPLCDGSHANGPFTPVAFKAEKTGETCLCQCKRTKNKPF